MPPPLAVRAAEISRLVRDEARRRGVRWTNQRQIIVDRFVLSGQHLSVEDLHRLARETDPTVSAATVYRTVNLLVELGIAHKRHFDGTGSASFEVAFQREHHDHLVCLSCGSIQEFQRDPIERLQEEVARDYGFTLADHRLELYGYCATCRAAGKEGAASKDGAAGKEGAASKDGAAGQEGAASKEGAAGMESTESRATLHRPPT